MESLGVMLSIIVVNTSSLNISHLTCKTFGLGTHLCSWAGKSRVTEKNSFVESKKRNSLFGALKLELDQTVETLQRTSALGSLQTHFTGVGGGQMFLLFSFWNQIIAD